MKRLDDPTVAEWLWYSDADVHAARALASDDASHFLAIGFHAQQAAEKRLKALLLALDRPFEKIHSLTALLSDLTDVLEVQPPLVEAAAWLTSFAVISRYPGFPLPEPDVAGSARRSLAAMQRLCETVDEAFALEADPSQTE